MNKKDNLKAPVRSMKYPNTIGSKRLPRLAIKFTTPKPVAASSSLEAMEESRKMGPKVTEPA